MGPVIWGDKPFGVILTEAPYRQHDALVHVHLTCDRRKSENDPPSFSGFRGSSKSSSTRFKTELLPRQVSVLPARSAGGFVAAVDAPCGVQPRCAATSASCRWIVDLYTLLRGIHAWPCCRYFVASVDVETERCSLIALPTAPPTTLYRSCFLNMEALSTCRFLGRRMAALKAAHLLNSLMKLPPLPLLQPRSLPACPSHPSPLGLRLVLAQKPQPQLL
jgi:hypothetical protein